MIITPENTTTRRAPVKPVKESYLTELINSRELLANLVMRDIKGKYRRTVFGQLWSLLHPLATMLVYTIVFSFLFKARPVPGDPSGLNIYPLWLMGGLLPWMFFTRVIHSGMGSIISNGSLIKKVYFPRMNLPLSAVGSTGFTWAIEMLVLTVALLICGSHVLPWIPVIAVMMVFMALFAGGLAMLLAMANVHFRDMQHFVQILLQMWMYLTPIIYPITLVQDAAKVYGGWILKVYELNPMERFVMVFRNLMYDNRWPELSDSLYVVIASVTVFALGSFVFAKNEKRLAELL